MKIKAGNKIWFRICLLLKKQQYVVCKIPLLARRTRPRQSARATIGYLVYKTICNNAVEYGCAPF